MMRQVAYAFVFSLVSALILTGLCSCSARTSSSPLALGPLGVSGNWSLLFDDEFSGNALDTSKWSVYTGSVYNNELQAYVTDDVSVHDGVLELKAENRSSGGKSYTSGKIITQGKFSFTYGLAEARIKVPKGQGLWPAFWMIPNDGSWPPEIDMMEILGQSPSTTYMTVHWGSSSSPQQDSKSSTGPDFSADYHVVSAEWAPTTINWYVDGVLARSAYTTSSNIPNMPFYLILNLAVGGNWPGSPDGTTIFPSSYFVDYVRVWQRQ